MKIFLVIAAGLFTAGSLASPLVERAKEATTADPVSHVDTTIVMPTAPLIPHIVETIDNVVYVTAPPVVVTVTEWIEITSGTSLNALESDQDDGLPSVTMRLPPLFSSHTGKSVVAATTICPSLPLHTTSPAHPVVSSTATSASSSEINEVLSASEETTPIVMTPFIGSLPTASIIQNLQPSSPAFTVLALYAHNVHRENHTDTASLQYNTTLEDFARQKTLTCIWDETLPEGADGVGMNMAEGTYIGTANITGTIGNMWYNGELGLFPGYGIQNPDMKNFQDWGHFTQVVWRATTSVGCWSSPCNRNDGVDNQIGSGYFTVCTYFPPGNVPGEYGGQVGTTLGKPTVHGV